MRVKQCLQILLAAAGRRAPLAQAAQPGTVRMGQIGLSFYAVTGGVVQEVLERLGHTVEVTTGSHGQIFPRLGAGEVDLLVAAWLPHGHAVYWKQYGDSAEQIAVSVRRRALRLDGAHLRAGERWWRPSRISRSPKSWRAWSTAFRAPGAIPAT